MDDRLAHIRRDVIGAGAKFDGPFGQKAMIYADWTASGRALASIEDYVREEVLPLYANTHTTTSTCGLQSTCFRQEARQLIAQACNARVGYSDKHADVVVFAGSGSTAAINKLSLILGLHLQRSHDAPDSAQPVVLVGPHEHHSNILPWRESCALVVQISEASDGTLCRESLRRALEKYKKHDLLIGSFSAASNVTGVCADVDAITEELHRFGALAFWDYAAAAPYLPIDMNPVRFQKDGSVNPHVYKDAVFLSPHKLPGGPGAPGVLVAKKKLFANQVPSEPGGGTVFFVTDSDQRYLSNRHEREEGGTQDIVGSVRAGLSFQTKTKIGQDVIGNAESRLREKVYDSLLSNENIAVLGPTHKTTNATATKTIRLPIVSFLVRAPADIVTGASRFLHHSFVCAVLNDVFGVQARGGCACAGPYALALLGLDHTSSACLETLLLDQSEVMRPGFVRLSLPYFASDSEIEYVLAAIHAVANHGWRLLALYRLDSKTGEWRHNSRARSFPERKWLAHLKFPGNDRVGGGGVHRAADTPAARGGTLEETQMNDARKTTSADSGWASPLSAACENERASFLQAQLETGLALLEQCGQTHSPQTSGKNQHHLRVPTIHELEWSGEREMLVNGARDEDESESENARVAYDVDEAKISERKETKVKGSSMKINLSTADAVRWFMFPSEGAALLRALLPKSEPRKKPGFGAHLPLSVSPRRGRIAGVIRPVGYDDTRGVDDPSSRPWPNGLEELVALDAEAKPFRAFSSKYPLRVTALSGEARVPGGSAVAKETVETAVETSAPVTVPEDLRDSLAWKRTTAEEIRNEDADGTESDSTRLEGSPQTAEFEKRAFATPPPKLMRSIAKAVSEWQMILPGDRVMLGLSGGKDSLAMLHVLKALQRRYPPNYFTLACCTIDPGTEAFNPRPLIAYCASLGVEYYYQEEKIMDMAAEHMSGDSICAFCARMKRGALYSCMRKHGYNKLVLAQHLDDVVESFLMSTMHNGLIRTMKAAYTVDEGDLTVIRPGIYVRERQLRDFSYAAGLPVINENCPACFEAPKERHHIKKLLAREECIFPSLYSCLRKALMPLLDPAAMDVLAAIRKSTEQQSKVGRQALRQRNASKSHSARANGKGDPSRERLDEPETDGAHRVVDGVDRCSADVSLRNCSETELLAELVARRTRGRSNKAKPVALVGSQNEKKEDLLGDAELRDDCDELNAFCTAEGCAVRAVRKRDEDDF